MTMYDQFDLFAQPEPFKSSAALVATVTSIASSEPEGELIAAPLSQGSNTLTQLPAVIDDLELLASTKGTIDEEINTPQAIVVPEAVALVEVEPVVSVIEQATSSGTETLGESAKDETKIDQAITDKPANGKKSAEAKQESKDDDADMAEEPELLIIETMIDGHVFITQELIVGVPARRHGYLGKYRGRWISLLNDEKAFARFSEDEKEAMRGRLKDSIFSPA